MKKSKAPYTHYHLEMDLPYVGHPVQGRGFCLPWRAVPTGGDAYHAVAVNCMVKQPSGRRCYKEHGSYYVSSDFLLLDNKKIICPYCASLTRIVRQLLPRHLRKAK